MTNRLTRVSSATQVVGSLIVALAVVSLLDGCGAAPSPATQTKIDQALNSTTGQLFCAFEKGPGVQIVGGLIATAANTAGGPAASQAVVLATNLTASTAQAACAQAALNIGAQMGVPVSPPADTVLVPQIAVDTTKLRAS